MMFEKIKLTRPELKHQRDILARYERYLPTLKLKQRLLQTTVLELTQVKKLADINEAKLENKIDDYRAVMDTQQTPEGEVLLLAKPSKLLIGQKNVAGVRVPVFNDIIFEKIQYSLFGSKPWVDQAIYDLRQLAEAKARAEVLEYQVYLLHKELTKINQRLNLFEKVMIPKTRQAIHRIGIYLGDEQTAAVGRAKIAKAKQAKLIEGISL